MGRRTILLIAALLVAVLGVVLVFLYANNATDSNQAQVKVIVAKSQITAGTTGAEAVNAGAFEELAVPEDAAAPSAISNPAAINELVALTTIYPGQQVITQQWGTEDQVTRLPLPEGKIALSLQLGDPERVAGFVSPGSTVAIFATGGPQIRTLLTNITVIGVGAVGLNSTPTTDGEQQQQTSSAILTLAVTQAEAEKIIYAQGLANPSTYTGLYFALMDDKSEVTPNDPGVDDTNLFR